LSNEAITSVLEALKSWEFSKDPRNPAKAIESWICSECGDLIEGVNAYFLHAEKCPRALLVPR
jgi:rubrerythrin